MATVMDGYTAASVRLALPRKGGILELSGPNGERAIVKRSGTDWVILYGIHNPLNDGWLHARWGNAEETRFDVAFFEENGTVHKVNGQSWA